jgi:hypothetical protein
MKENRNSFYSVKQEDAAVEEERWKNGRMEELRDRYWLHYPYHEIKKKYYLTAYILNYVGN